MNQDQIFIRNLVLQRLLHAGWHGEETNNFFDENDDVYAEAVCSYRNNFVELIAMYEASNNRLYITMQDDSQRLDLAFLSLDNIDDILSIICDNTNTINFREYKKMILNLLNICANPYLIHNNELILISEDMLGTPK